MTNDKLNLIEYVRSNKSISYDEANTILEAFGVAYRYEEPVMDGLIVVSGFQSVKSQDLLNVILLEKLA